MSVDGPGQSGTADTAVSKAARGALYATCLSTLVVNANTSAVSILLPAISDDTGTSVDTLQWAVTGYSLMGAAVIVTAGAMGDVFGRKRVFQLGLLLFIASCVFIALSTSGVAVILGRIIQGAAGATILACGLSILTVATAGGAQLRAVSLWGAAAAVGAAAGPLAGGVLVDITGWQGLFWIDAAVALIDDRAVGVGHHHAGALGLKFIVEDNRNLGRRLLQFGPVGRIRTDHFAVRRGEGRQTQQQPEDNDQ